MFKFFGNKSNISKTKQLPKASQPGIQVDIDDAGTKAVMKFGNAQHIGSRKNQEDSFGYSNIVSGEEISVKGVFAVLADGMGGLAHGKQISEYVVSAAKTMFEFFDCSLPFPDQMENMVRKINKEISENFNVDGRSNAGSTMAAAFVYKTRFYWACVGDSRIYLLRDGQLYQINEDHDYLNEMHAGSIYGEFTLEEAGHHPQKDSLTSYIGSQSLPYIDFNKRGFSLQKNDTIVLCSDGVYNGLNGSELVEYLSEDPQFAVDRVVKNIVKKKLPSQDNVTIMSINYN